MQDWYRDMSKVIYTMYYGLDSCFLGDKNTKSRRAAAKAGGKGICVI